MRSNGVTLTEVLVVLAIVAVVVALWWMYGPPSHTALSGFADILSREVRVVRHQSVLVGLRSDCIASSSAFVVQWPSRGLLFTPDGLPRTCDGGGVGNTTILLEHRGRQAAVIVSSLGRVRWELR